jgi:uncharacterized protein (TIGR01319 family)
LEAIAREAGLGPERISTLVNRMAHETGMLPATADEAALDLALVRAAITLAVRRHCGTVATQYTPTGPVIVQRGKDLSNVAAVIGTGGAVVASPDPRAILSCALADPADPVSLRPRHPRLLLDRHYLLYACGLLGAVDARAALELALRYLEPLHQESAHECTRHG